jgi:hypothetical protein
MPGKSRKKGRYTPQVKKQGGAVNPSESIIQEAGVQTSTPAPVVKAAVATPPAARPAVPAATRVAPAARSIIPAVMLKASAVRYQNVKKELLTIGVLAAVILIILIAVAMFLT